ncbi:MAG: hypothetical protein COW59_07610 [Lysobacterales bacterium CG17_big_fil_post_rev_8_21_14_2_50_64_11]|nr:MAG: hypothetical protein COW59_07610 [Xanthomonadales bacterium CG17_big_fil_post_rev_8_21_14_2_50_64_11]PIX61755.1 MAG: hypothetical protein COZ47_00280 [Xanthomonadales bacterium CG_4_10_14_3_um_filter_64_11]
MNATTFPAPEPHALAHSAGLANQIRTEIAVSGTIPFSRYMELVLYAPGLGYYSAGAAKFGEDGDFITAPELGPLFAQCVACALAPVLRALAAETVFFELGGGSGAFACDALQALAVLDAVPTRYEILEPSADLRQRQQQRVNATLAPELAARVHWRDTPPTHAWRGVLFANEVLDALPTPRFQIRDGEVLEVHVACADDGTFIDTLRPADAMLGSAVRHVEHDLEQPFAENYRSELLPQLPYWIQAIGGLLHEGVMLFADYGYPRREYYSPQRCDGTLVCHYRHRAHTNPYRLPGLQDLTAFVDFTALAEAGCGAGFDFAGYCSQASFLLGNGLGERLQAAQSLPDVERYRLNTVAKRLTLPGEMGERFQVMGFARGVDFSAAFALGDLSRRL